MTTKNAFAGILLAATLSLLIFSCASSMKSTIQDDGKQIPPGFGKKTETLLVIRKNKKSYDKYLEKNFEENYFGKYMIIDAADTLNRFYKNTDVYRYIFDQDHHVDIPKYSGTQIAAANKHDMETKSGPSLNYVPDLSDQFQVMDRKSGVIYKTKKASGSWSWWMKSYIQALEKARQKN